MSQVWALITSEDFDFSQQEAQLRQALKVDLQSLDKTRLPLQQGMTQGSYVGTSPFQVLINSIELNQQILSVRFGVFYTSVIAGCNCADDPGTVDELNEYCDCELTLNGDGRSEIRLL